MKKRRQILIEINDWPPKGRKRDKSPGAEKFQKNECKGCTVIKGKRNPLPSSVGCSHFLPKRTVWEGGEKNKFMVEEPDKTLPQPGDQGQHQQP